MNLRLRRLIKGFVFTILVIVVINIVFLILWILKWDFFSLEIVVILSTLMLLLPMMIFFAFILWERQQQKTLPPSEINVDFVRKIMNAKQNLLISFNTNYEILWTNNPQWLQKILGLSRPSLLYGKKITSFLTSEQKQLFEQRQMQNFLLHFPVSQKRFLASNLSDYLLLLQPKQLLWEIKTFLHRERPVFLFLEIDDNISFNFEDTKLNKLTKNLSAFLSIQINDFFQNRESIVLELAENEFVITMPYSVMTELLTTKFNFLDNFTKQIQIQYKSNITFSGGVFLPEHKPIQFFHNKDIKPFALETSFNKSLQAKKIAQTRGGDQIIVMKFDDSFSTYGKQQKILPLLANAKHKYNKLCKLLPNYEHVVIAGHRFPDLDTIGAGIGLKLWIKTSFPQIATTFVTNSISKNSLNEFDNFMENKEWQKHIQQNFDFSKWIHNEGKKLIIFVDTNNPNYTDFAASDIAEIDQAIFDHHLPQFQLKKVVFEYSGLQFSSASEVVLNIWMCEKNLKRAPLFVLKGLLGGILLDTNNLQRNMNQNTLSAINFLNKYVEIQTYIDKFKKIKILAQKNSAQTSAKMQIAKSFGDILVLTQQHNSASQINAASAAEQYLSNHPIKTVIVVMNKTAQSDIFLSVRSETHGLNAAHLCELFAGGGDSQRAAAQIIVTKSKYNINKVLQIIIAHVEKKLSLDSAKLDR